MHTKHSQHAPLELPKPYAFDSIVDGDDFLGGVQFTAVIGGRLVGVFHHAACFGRGHCKKEAPGVSRSQRDAEEENGARG